MQLNMDLEMEINSEFEDDEEIFDYQEKSIFQTTQPRLPGTATHLTIVLSCFLSAFAVAVICIENKNSNIEIAIKSSLESEQKIEEDESMSLNRFWNYVLKQ